MRLILIIEAKHAQNVRGTSSKVGIPKFLVSEERQPYCLEVHCLPNVTFDSAVNLR
jgi:hypothetical protein